MHILRPSASVVDAAVEVGGIRTFSVPMLKDDELIGVITITARGAALHGQADRAGQNFAAQAVIAIEKLGCSTRSGSAPTTCRSVKQQTAHWADVLKVISRSTFDLKTVLRHPSRSGRPTVRGRSGYYRPRAGRRVLNCVATYGFIRRIHRSTLRTLPVIPERGTATGRAPA